MKVRHIGFLLVGVALAGSLAVKMTQAPAIPVVAPVLPVERPAVVSPVVSAVSPVVSPPVAKPSPIPAPPERVAPERVPLPARAAAPQPVYDEPAKPAIRKFKPISTASVTRIKPTQWTPGPYEGATGAGSPKPQPQTQTTVVEQRVEQRVEPRVELPAVEAKSAPAPRHVTLETGMAIPIRLDESLSSDRTVTGATFQGVACRAVYRRRAGDS